MALVTCPFCGTIFMTKEGGCPTCTYRLPKEQVSPLCHRAGAAAMERTSRWLRHVAGKVHEALPHHHRR